MLRTFPLRRVNRRLSCRRIVPAINEEEEREDEEREEEQHEVEEEELEEEEQEMEYDRALL